MSNNSLRTVYVNGDYLPENEAHVSVFDRGFLFADGVYEVTTVLDGRLVDFESHMARLHRSLGEIGMSLAMAESELLAIHRELVQRNGVDQGLVYLQVTRGAADRDFVYPATGTPATLVLFTQQKALLEAPAARDGLRVVSLPDLRWNRRDIKTVQLLYPSMAKMEAKRRGADDAWLVEEGQVTEGSSSNAWLLDHDDTLVTRALSHSILPGITRSAVMAFAEEQGMRVEERGFTIEEAQAARAAFVTSATSFVTPVVEIDGQPIGDGRPLPAMSRLRERFIEESRRRAI
ncbi:D-alanine transaminase [Kushneria sinocarnis]|uniref:Aminodeoxychorismate lyase n=1 Tax=Kushneria sinocarnis TaxID=595502 RepID=A0A420WTP1_9GAMM|nr:D-amino-acid transaminase [Kushneria sinocarnis]RKQ96897.1 D-alanine transaminase [Kushneria sinocarnis]